MLTQERLKEFWHYCQDTGNFTNIKARRGTRVGFVAGCIGNHGYRVIKVDGKTYLGHRLAWLYVHGEFPQNQIDHINRNRADNRLCNLRLATQFENMQNTQKPSHNSSGHIGVSWERRRNKWRAHITKNGKMVAIGEFAYIEDAITARKAAEIKFHTFQHGESISGVAGRTTRTQALHSGRLESHQGQVFGNGA